MSNHNHQHQHFGAAPPNPLRPYYIPPAPLPFGEAASSTATAAATVSPSANFAAPSSYAILQDFQEYSSDYLESPSVAEAMRSLLDQAILKYTSILISQPFEVAKTVLQCQYVPRREGRTKSGPRGSATSPEEYTAEDDEKSEAEEENPWTTFEEDEEEGENSDDEPKYFSSAISPAESPAEHASKVPITGPKKLTDRAGYVLEDKTDVVTRPDYQIRKCGSSSVNEAMRALWAKEGAWGIWKGTNATFIHSVLVSTLEAWSTSFISAILSLPDPGVTEIADSTHPMASLGIAIVASAITALLLSPLDVIRTKLILTPSTSKPRNLVPSLRALPSYFVPIQLILPTTLHAVVPSLISLTTPYFLKTKLHLDPLVSPFSFNFFSFVSSTVEMCVRMPLETVLRRAQIAESKPERTIVPVGRYAGVVGTAWVLMKEEERGKWGVEGLYRAWRVSAWSNVGVLGLGLLGVQTGTTNEF